jgi:glucose/mannose-6-phosphate isomerase
VLTTARASALDRSAVEAVDSTGQASVMLALGTQLSDALRRVDAAALPPLDAPGGLVVAGMGGSAIGGRLAAGALGSRARRPVIVADGYALPPWVDERTLVLCSSYSGGTAETLACYEDARARGAQLLVATTGGALASRALHNGVPIIRLPHGLQPRAAVGYSLVCALEAAALAGAAPALRTELQAAAVAIDDWAAEWGPEGPVDAEPKTLARRLDGTVPVVVGAGLTAPVAYRWKCQLNENAKVPAFWSALPEADHNEICGWEAARGRGDFAAVFLDDRGAAPAVRRRVELTAQLARVGARVTVLVGAHGVTALERLLSLVLLGDLVSLYVAVLRDVDPVEIDAIRQLKSALAGG